MKRQLRPRPTLTTSPVAVTQYTAPAIFGFKNERSFLEFVAALEVEHARVGHTTFVDVEVMRCVLRELASKDGAEIVGIRAAAHEQQPQTAADVLRVLGRRVAGGAR